VSAFLVLAAAGLCIAHSLLLWERVRLAGIDAQQRPRLAGSKNPAWCEYRVGSRGRDALQAFVLTGRVSIERFGSATTSGPRHA